MEQVGSYGENSKWEIDDGNDHRPYICAPGECAELVEDDEEEDGDSDQLPAPKILRVTEQAFANSILNPMTDEEMIAAIESMPGQRVVKSDLGGFFVEYDNDEATEDYPTIAQLYASLSEDDDEGCPKDDGSPHTPDWNTLTVRRDDTGIYVDVNCVNCGRSGCVYKGDVRDEIQW